jgi:hypothetical protein
MSFEPARPDSDRATQIVAHVARHIVPPEKLWHEIISNIVRIDVHHIPPASGREFHTLFTTGMSDQPMQIPGGLDDLRYAELIICLPPDWPIDEAAFRRMTYFWPVYLLQRLARLPHEYNTWFGELHTIPNGDPPEAFADNTNFCGVIFGRPVRFGPAFPVVTLDDGRIVHLYALLPLYGPELSFKLEHGGPALMQRLQAAGVDEVLDLERRRVV